jgi:rRNA maturation endonuclease Nob1
MTHEALRRAPYGSNNPLLEESKSMHSTSKQSNTHEKRLSCVECKKTWIAFGSTVAKPCPFCGGASRETPVER